MLALIEHYNPWLLLAAVFIAMYWFGEAIGGGGDSRQQSQEGQVEAAAATDTRPDFGLPRRLFTLKIGR